MQTQLRTEDKAEWEALVQQHYPGAGIEKDQYEDLHVRQDGEEVAYWLERTGLGAVIVKAP